MSADVPAGRGRDKARLVSLSKAGFGALAAGRLEEAGRWFRELLLADSRNSYALVGLAETARAKKDLRSALGAYEQCVGFHPDNPRALGGLFECLRELEELPRAVEIWESRLRDGRPTPMVCTHAGDLYRRLGRFEDSRAAYQRALDREPANRYALNGMAQLNFDSERYEDARVFWERAREAAPDDIRVLTSLGNCFRKTRHYAEALACYQAALKLEPRNFFARYGVADSCRGLEMTEESLRAWETLVEQEPANRILLTRAGDACRKLRKLETAERYYRAALAIGFDAYATLGLAQVARMSGDPTHAIPLLLDLLAREPGNDRAALEAADCYLETGEPARAVELLARFPESGPKAARIREKLAEIGS